ncbi:hypothetical protein Tsubulata_045428 [Turnera subulata]|uniref:Uncharacterized protein n=1 Tax=Turnera subulata TaxID=218843 RepID=A0A9Q0F0R1_9ROSI|nr:hypothetical protein Tsubulata_045428 [Turnera subulata]
MGSISPLGFSSQSRTSSPSSLMLTSTSLLVLLPLRSLVDLRSHSTREERPAVQSQQIRRIERGRAILQAATLL